MTSSLSPHVLVQRARVGTASLRQYDVRPIEGEPALVIALALSPPRLWGYVLDATLDGFVDGFQRPHDNKSSTRIHQGLRVAQNTLRGRIDALIDRRGADAALLGLAREGNVLHVLSVGELGAYIYRNRQLRRVTGHEPASEGILKAEPTWSAEAIESGDLLFAANNALCTEAALERVREACAANRELAPGAVAGILLGDSNQSAAVVAFRG